MEKINEEWRPVVGYEGWYEVSNYGRVRSLDRYVNAKNGSAELKKGVLLEQRDNGKGYLRVTLSKNGKVKQPRVHRLVAEAFIPNPDNLPEVNHKNFDKSDNRVENLNWCSHIQNIRYGDTVERMIKSRFKPIDMLLNGVVVNHFNSSEEAAFFIKTTAASIRAAINKGKGFGYQWRYT